jgi:GGDEF domain-containing protein
MLEQRLAGGLKKRNEKEDQRFHLSLNVGILNCDDSLGSIPIEDLLSQADTLVYEQKQGRKNRGMLPVR